MRRNRLYGRNCRNSDLRGQLRRHLLTRTRRPVRAPTPEHCGLITLGAMIERIELLTVR